MWAQSQSNRSCCEYAPFADQTKLNTEAFGRVGLLYAKENRNRKIDPNQKRLFRFNKIYGADKSERFGAHMLATIGKTGLKPAENLNSKSTYRRW
jgi:hypothetical protein